jgi:hypothetical protein
MMLELPCCPSVIARTIFIVFFHHRSYGGGGHKPNGAAFVYLRISHRFYGNKMFAGTGCAKP